MHGGRPRDLCDSPTSWVRPGPMACSLALSRAARSFRRPPVHTQSTATIHNPQPTHPDPFVRPRSLLEVRCFPFLSPPAVAAAASPPRSPLLLTESMPLSLELAPMESLKDRTPSLPISGAKLHRFSQAPEHLAAAGSEHQIAFVCLTRGFLLRRENHPVVGIQPLRIRLP